jgi:hypothetical protein
MAFKSKLLMMGCFHHIPIKGISIFTEIFRRWVIKMFVNKGSLDRGFALKILSYCSVYGNGHSKSPG